MGDDKHHDVGIAVEIVDSVGIAVEIVESAGVQGSDALDDEWEKIQTMLSTIKIMRKKINSSIIQKLNNSLPSGYFFKPRDKVHKARSRSNLKTEKFVRDVTFADLLLNEKEPIKIRQYHTESITLDKLEKDFENIVLKMWGIHVATLYTDQNLQDIRDQAKINLSKKSSNPISILIYFCVCVLLEQQNNNTTFENPTKKPRIDPIFYPDLVHSRRLNEEDEDLSVDDDDEFMRSIVDDLSQDMRKMDILKNENKALKDLIRDYGEIQFEKLDLKYIFDNGETLREILVSYGLSDIFPMGCDEGKAIGEGVKMELNLRYMPKIKRPGHKYFCTLYFTSRTKKCVSRHIVYHLKQKGESIPPQLNDIKVDEESDTAKKAVEAKKNVQSIKCKNKTV